MRMYVVIIKSLWFNSWTNTMFSFGQLVVHCVWNTEGDAVTITGGTVQLFILIILPLCWSISYLFVWDYILIVHILIYNRRIHPERDVFQLVLVLSCTSFCSKLCPFWLQWLRLWNPWMSSSLSLKQSEQPNNQTTKQSSNLDPLSMMTEMRWPMDIPSLIVCLFVCCWSTWSNKLT